MPFLAKSFCQAGRKFLSNKAEIRRRGGLLLREAQSVSHYEPLRSCKPAICCRSRGLSIERLEEFHPDQVNVTGSLLPSDPSRNRRGLRGQHPRGRRWGHRDGEVSDVVCAQQAGTREIGASGAHIEGFCQVQEFCPGRIYTPNEHGDLHTDAWRTAPLCGVKAHALSLQTGPDHAESRGTCELVPHEGCSLGARYPPREQLSTRPLFPIT